MGVIYLLQLFELPYLLQIGDRDALLYVNAFSLLFFSIQMLVMCQCYFFPQTKLRLLDYWLFIPAVVVLAPMFLHAVNLVQMPDGWRVWTVGAVSLLFMLYFLHSVRMTLRIRAEVRRANEDCYGDSADFPVDFANLIRWVPTLVLVLLAINFYADNPWVKFGHDLLFTCASVWFCILTLNPWRKATSALPEHPEAPEDPEVTAHLLSKNRFEELSRKLDRLLVEEHIFTRQHITIDTLVSHLGTNSKYLTEVIRRSGYASFYDMISQHRVRHAISLIHEQPDARLADIADQCGFSSPASMSKAFKSQGKDTPSSYR